MMDLIPSNDAEFLQQLIVFNTNIPTYAHGVGVSSGQMDSTAADEASFAYAVGTANSIKAGGHQWVNFKNNLRHGYNLSLAEADMPLSAPYAPPVVPGIEKRFRALVKQIKSHPGYTDAIGKALGIVCPTPAPLDLTTVKPIISATIDGGDVRVYWNWGHYRGPLQSCEIHVDRNDGKGFVLLVMDVTPNYIDTYPHPATVTQWTYKAIYRAKDRQVGLWSDLCTIAVGG